MSENQQEQLSPEELKERKEKRNADLKESIPFLTTERDHAQLLYDLDKIRLERLKIQIEHMSLLNALQGEEQSTKPAQKKKGPLRKA